MRPSSAPSRHMLRCLAMIYKAGGEINIVQDRRIHKTTIRGMIRRGLAVEHRRDREIVQLTLRGAAASREYWEG